MIEPIACQKIYGKRASGERVVIELEIGKPYLRQEYGPNDWACPVSVKPLYSNLADSAGGDPVQALCLAISLAFNLLAGFCKEGGLLEYEDGTTFSLEAYSFGNLLR